MDFFYELPVMITQISKRSTSFFIFFSLCSKSDRKAPLDSFPFF